MRRRINRLIAALLAALCLTAAWAEEALPTPEPTPAPTATPAPEATAAPEVTPTPAATEAPEVTEVPEVTEAPEVTESPEITESPEVTEVPEATESPEVTPSPEATSAPEETPAPGETESPIPTETPVPESTPEPTPSPEIIVVTVLEPEGLVPVDGVYTLDARVRAVVFTWTADVPWDAFELSILDETGEALRTEALTEARWTLLPDEYESGLYTLRVRALLEGEALAEALAALSIPEREGFPRGGHWRGGAFRLGNRGAAFTQAGDEMPGFRVTPGTALTDDHSSGTKDLTPHGGVALEVSGEAETALTLGGEALDVCLEGGLRAFTAQLDGDALTLTAQTPGGTWQLSGAALKTLSRSGVQSLTLGGVTLETGLELSGAAYEALRAKGVPTREMIYFISAGCVEIQADGARYTLSRDGEMTLKEG